MDKIIINGLKIHAFHGVNPEEKENGQLFEIDVVATLDANSARRTDDIDDTVSYSKMIKKITAVFTAEKYNLLECAADKLAFALLEEFSRLESVSVTLKKPEAPIKADFNYVAVEVSATRDDLRTRLERI